MYELQKDEMFCQEIIAPNGSAGIEYGFRSYDDAYSDAQDFILEKYGCGKMASRCRIRVGVYNVKSCNPDVRWLQEDTIDNL